MKKKRSTTSEGFEYMVRRVRDSLTLFYHDFYTKYCILNIVGQMFRSERGVSVIVGAIVLIIILLSAFAAFYPFYVNKTVSEAEYNHMKSVKNSFFEIKSKVESMQVGRTGSVTIPMSINPPLLFFGSVPSGTISVHNSENKFNTIDFTILSRYSPSQTYAYEGGGVVLKQNGTGIMKSDPTLVKVWNAEGDNVRVNVRYLLIENSNFTVTSKDARTVQVDKISSKYTSENEHLEKVVINLENKVRYVDAWKNYLEDTSAELDQEGYHTELDNLKLTIHGKNKDNVQDIFYYERHTEVKVSCS